MSALTHKNRPLLFIPTPCFWHLLYDANHTAEGSCQLQKCLVIWGPAKSWTSHLPLFLSSSEINYYCTILNWTVSHNRCLAWGGLPPDLSLTLMSLTSLFLMHCTQDALLSFLSLKCSNIFPGSQRLFSFFLFLECSAYSLLIIQAEIHSLEEVFSDHHPK